MLAVRIRKIIEEFSAGAKPIVYCLPTGSLVISVRNKHGEECAARSLYRLPIGYAWKAWHVQWHDMPAPIGRSPMLPAPLEQWKNAGQKEGTMEDRLVVPLRDYDCIHSYEPSGAKGAANDPFYPGETYLFDTQTGHRTNAPRKTSVLIDQSAGRLIYALNGIARDRRCHSGAWGFRKKDNMFIATVAGEFMVSCKGESI